MENTDLFAFDSIENLVLGAFDAVKPPLRISVSEAAEAYRILRDSPVLTGRWDNKVAPYMVEPTDMMLSRLFRAVVFVGPSQSSKTESFFNLLCHAVMCDPGAILLVHMTQDQAGSFTKTRLNPFHRHTSVVGDRLLPGASNNGLYFKRYLGGARLSIGWPTINSLSSRSFRTVFLTDYDRMPLDVDGEGNAFDLSMARTTTFGRRGGVFAESTPGFDFEENDWSPDFPHQGPPVPGIVALYNRGDCRRWYWRCVECHLAFEPAWSLMHYPKDADPLEAGEQAYLGCPHCGAVYEEDSTDRPGRYEMNLNGKWLVSGQTWAKDGSVVGDARRSDIVSYWLKGPAAAMRKWSEMVSDMVRAEIEWNNALDEASLRTKTNTTLGEVYVPKSTAGDRSPEQYRQRAYDYGFKLVPAGGRFLVASVDVQYNRFEVQVHAIGKGGDIWIVDRFAIRESCRDDPNREGVKAGVQPFVYAEDWKVLVEQVLAVEYELADGSPRRMRLKAAVCDSVGGDRTTTNAYEFWRWLKRGPDEEERERGLYDAWGPHHIELLWLYHGMVVRNAPRTQIAYPDSGHRGKDAGAKGEIPILRSHSDLQKDELYARLGREELGTGAIHFADWLSLDWYRELTAEKRDPVKKTWLNPSGRRRNESWDLLCMCLAACNERMIIGWNHFDWANPPLWAAEWDDNELIYDTTLDPSLEVRHEREKRGRGEDAAAKKERRRRALGWG